jgi:hypothetical protein
MKRVQDRNILNNKYKFGTVQETLQPINVYNEGKLMTYWESCFIQQYKQNGLLIEEQTVNEPSPLFNLIIYSQGPRGLRRRSAAERLLGSWVRIPPWAWIFFSCTVFVLLGRDPYDGLIPCPEESYRLWCVSECAVCALLNGSASDP